ncbi:MAG: hypothetical protein KatS3mg038_0918 [Candidatus Kapaibacterium sp.]|nr:MAG: hypothetical protein KatS3mg038_0918 [Candidatus Kapabacteria bacterium]
MIRRACSCMLLVVALAAYGQIPQRTLRPAEEQPTQSVAVQTANYAISVGAFVAAKVGVNTTVAKGRKTDLNFNPLPDLGISIYAPFQSGGRIGAGVDIGYATYSFVNQPESGVTDANSIVERYSYVNIFPHVNLHGVVFGVNVGFSPSGRAETKSGDQVTVVTDGSREIGSEHLGTLVELRLGGNFPVWEHQTGHLNLYVMAGYTVSGLYSDYRTYIYSRDNYTTPSADNNPRPASLALGLAYYFRIPIQ